MSTKLSNFFNVIVESQTYLNMLYLLFSFPLGIFYFVILITGISLGIGLFITLLGAPVLLGTLLLWRVLAGGEQILARIMLGIDISFSSIEPTTGIWKKIKVYLKDSYTWKSLVYLLIKFPLGIVSFVVLVTFLSIAFGFIAAPILYYLTQLGLISGIFCIDAIKVCFINSYLSASIWGIFGVILLFVFMHALNGLARISGMLTKSMLESKE